GCPAAQRGVWATGGQRPGGGRRSAPNTNRSPTRGGLAPAEALDVDQITAVRPVWTGRTPPAEDEPIEAIVQLRAHGETFSANYWLQDGSLRIGLHSPARGVARGQAAVLYDGDVVLGSATIAGASLAAVPA